MVNVRDWQPPPFVPRYEDLLARVRELGQARQHELAYIAETLNKCRKATPSDIRDELNDLRAWLENRRTMWAFLLNQTENSMDEPIVVMRPYPYIICNAARPDECKREPDGYCVDCHIPGFHANRAITADTSGES